MIDIHQIRGDLKEIRYYYYALKDEFDRHRKTVFPVVATNIVNRYNNAIEKAPIRLFTLYVKLYLENNSQAVVAEDWDLCKKSIKLLNDKLVAFLQQTLED